MEAAVLRVKRKRGADPAGALIIDCKRPRAEVSSQVFRLAATVRSQNESIQKCVQEAIFRDRATQVHCPPIGSLQQIQKDLRAWRNAKRQESRYRLVSSLRPKCEVEGSKSDNSRPAEEQQHEPEKVEASANGEMAYKGGKDETFQVFDIIQEETEKETSDVKASDPETIMCNSVKMIRERMAVSEEVPGSEHRESPEEFVYDIYYAESSSSNWIQDILSVQPYYHEQALIADDDDEEPNEVYEDEDDENEENNWRNDYPDEVDERCSDLEERYMGYYEDSDEDTEHGRGHAWDVYRQKALRECENDDEEHSD